MDVRGFSFVVSTVYAQNLLTHRLGLALESGLHWRQPIKCKAPGAAGGAAPEPARVLDVTRLEGTRESEPQRLPQNYPILIMHNSMANLGFKMGLSSMRPAPGSGVTYAAA